MYAFLLYVCFMLFPSLLVSFFIVFFFIYCAVYCSRKSFSKHNKLLSLSLRPSPLLHISHLHTRFLYAVNQRSIVSSGSVGRSWVGEEELLHCRIESPTDNSKGNEVPPTGPIPTKKKLPDRTKEENLSLRESRARR